MKLYSFVAGTAVVGVGVAFQGSVNLQATTPGTAQTGHSNITGTAKAGIMVGYSNTPTGIAFGGDFRSVSTSGRGVLGNASATTGATYGGLFQSFSNAGRGVAGIAQNLTGNTYGGFFSSLSVAGFGVYGQATAGSGATYGVYGKATSPTGFGIYSEGNMSATGVISGNGSGLSSVNAAQLGGFLPAAFLQEIPNPLTLSGTNSTHIVRGENTSTVNNAAGVMGEATAVSGYTIGTRGVSRSQTGYGVFGEASSSSGNNYGGWFQSYGTSGTGVHGYAIASSGTTYGGYFQSNSSGGRGVYGTGVYGGEFWGAGRGVVGNATNNTGNTFGGIFTSNSISGTGVLGAATDFSGPTYGGYFSAQSPVGEGVRGINSSSSGSASGGYFVSASLSARALYGLATGAAGTTYGVVGQSNSDVGYGVWGTSGGNGYGVFAAGHLGASGIKSFRIDHPSDPENKYLLHYSSESPMPQNFYVGNVVTDAKGYAWVQLPDYFGEINTNFKYQLTVVRDDESPNFVQVQVGKKIKDGRFLVMTSAPSTEVSWRVDADRNDLYVRRHPPKAETNKQGPERGTYQHPELYGYGPERGMNYDPLHAKKPVHPEAQQLPGARRKK